MIHSCNFADTQSYVIYETIDLFILTFYIVNHRPSAAHVSLARACCDSGIRQAATAAGIQSTGREDNSQLSLSHAQRSPVHSRHGRIPLLPLPSYAMEGAVAENESGWNHSSFHLCVLEYP